MSKIHLYNTLVEGWNKRQERTAPDEIGIWRGGNSGCFIEGDRAIGASPRTTVLRFLGIQMKPTFDQSIIFDAGLGNETLVTDLLEETDVPFREGPTCSVKWEIENGETLRGSPDILIEDEEVGKYGVEIKLISSNRTAVEHPHFGIANPDTKHVCQAANYSYKMKMPWVLHYINRAYFVTFYRKQGWNLMEHRCMMLDEKSRKVIMVSPYMSLYDITWKGDTVYLDDRETKITGDGISAFYNYCSSCVREKVIPVVGGYYDTFGKKKDKNYNEIYDDFKEARRDSWDNWIHDCRKIAEDL